MHYKKLLGAASAALMIVIAILMLTPCAGAANKYKTLYRFKGGADGSEPTAALIFDAAGNLYGTTGSGGAYPYGYGVVFKLTPKAGGGWTENVIHSFNNSDGNYPHAGLIFDQAGNLYGTTTFGGGTNYSGTVFKLTKNEDGSWTESVLYAFPDDGVHGGGPYAGLIFDSAGNLYGADSGTGAYGNGMVFKLTPNPDGSWTENDIYSFNGADGAGPDASLIFDQRGNLYGTTKMGGEFDDGGTAFELTPNADGTWTESVLHSFSFHHHGHDGADPEASLIFDTAGNLYGTTSYGGLYGAGTVFQLAPNGDGTWIEHRLHSFPPKNGFLPNGLIFDSAGNLYGTTSLGGTHGYGTVFKLTPTLKGAWKTTLPHSFGNNPGAYPNSSLIFDAHGNLYGTTEGGTAPNFGSVFEITP
jgi:uncharacterized repeat protein (TIGR03803 family)